MARQTVIEDTGLKLRLIVYLSLGILLALLLVLWGSGLMFRDVVTQSLNKREHQPPDLVLAHSRHINHELLSQYAWKDRSLQIVRIPIEEAMDLVVQRYRP